MKILIVVLIVIAVLFVVLMVWKQLKSISDGREEL